MMTKSQDIQVIQRSVPAALVHYFRIFYGYASRGMLVLCIAIFFSGLFDGLGLSMLLPILNFEDLSSNQNSYSKLIYHFLEAVGLKVSLFSLLALMFLLFLAKGILMFLIGVIMSKITTTIAKEQRLKLCGQYAHMNYSYYTDSTIGFLNNAVTTEVDRAVAAFSKYTEVITIGVDIFVYLGVVFLMNWRIALLVLCVCLCLFALLKRLSDFSRELSVRVSQKNAQIQSLLIQMIYHFKYLKSTELFAPIHKQLEARIEEHRRYNLQNNILSLIPNSLLEPSAVLFLSVLILYYVNVQGRPLSEIFVFLLFLYRAFSRAFGFQINWHKFCASVGGVEAVDKVLQDLAVHREADGDKLVSGLKEAIVMNDVTFHYGDKMILQNVNLRVPKNKTIGIVGESGAGKTTLFDIMTNVLKPQGGVVTIDGLSYQDLQSASLRRIIGYVTQEPVIFNDTIANNITFWDQTLFPEERKKRMEEVAAQAHCVEFISRTSDGYDTVIGDKGVKLSVGQRQRIAIARELFRDPQVMIFDEATSALDTQSERFIQDSIMNMRGTRTMVIVAHRLSTVKNCDFIYVLSRGKVVESGPFAELYGNPQSLFHQMCKMQNI